MKCKRFEECGREVYADATGLCLAHEKERRANEAKPAPKKATAKKATAKKSTAPVDPTPAPDDEDDDT